MGFDKLFLLKILKGTLAKLEARKIKTGQALL
jgi:hypothetical protein